MTLCISTYLPPPGYILVAVPEPRVRLIMMIEWLASGTFTSRVLRTCHGDNNQPTSIQSTMSTIIIFTHPSSGGSKRASITPDGCNGRSRTMDVFSPLLYHVKEGWKYLVNSTFPSNSGLRTCESQQTGGRVFGEERVNMILV